MYYMSIGESLNQIPLCDHTKPRTTSNTRKTEYLRKYKQLRRYLWATSNT